MMIKFLYFLIFTIFASMEFYIIHRASADDWKDDLEYHYEEAKNDLGEIAENIEAQSEDFMEKLDNLSEEIKEDLEFKLEIIKEEIGNLLNKKPTEKDWERFKENVSHNIDNMTKELKELFK